MLSESTSDQIRSFRRLNGPGDLVTLRKSCLSRLEAEHERLQNFANVILGSRDKDKIGVHFFDYAILAKNLREHNPVLYATHDAGLFSCLTTIMWSILEIQHLDMELPARINNTFGMDRFKSALASNTFDQWFQQPSSPALRQLSITRALGALDASPRVFDHHGDYHGLYQSQLGPEWVKAYRKAYMRPSDRLKEAIASIENKYKIRQRKTLVVCYRGTDKHTELRQDPVSAYLERAQALADELDIKQVLIQTDQQQVRSLFMQTFQRQCIFIKELPTTDGSIVLHQKLAGKIDLESWSLNLIAMVHACSKAACVISHTGNLGLFLSLLTMINGGQLLQLR